VKLIEVLGETLKVRYSHSFGKNALCPRSLKLHYIDKVDERFVRVAAERGRSAHQALYELIQYCLDEKIDVADLADELIREAVERSTPHAIMSEVGLIFGWLRLWRERFQIPRNLYGIEEKIAIDDEFEDCNWEDASYRGIIDLLQISGSHATVTDWKSQPHILSKTDLDDASASDVAEQLTFYCWLAWKLYPYLETFSARIWYLRYGFYSETSRTEADLEAYEHTLMIKEKKISEIDSWDPIPGKQCTYCDFIHTCPLANDLSPDNREVITQEQAVLAAQRVYTMDALSKELKGKLKTYVNSNDEVSFGSDHVWGYHKRESPSWPVEKVEEILRDHDRDLSEVAKVDSNKMKKFLKTAAREDVVLEGAIRDVEEVKHTTTFKGSQKKPDAG
jgi:hypothetical protein